MICDELCVLPFWPSAKDLPLNSNGEFAPSAIEYSVTLGLASIISETLESPTTPMSLA